MVAQILTALRRARLDGWTIAAWLTGPQVELGGTSPAAWLRAARDPDLVVAVAERAAAPLER